MSVTGKSGEQIPIPMHNDTVTTESKLNQNQDVYSLALLQCLELTDHITHFDASSPSRDLCRQGQE